MTTQTLTQEVHLVNIISIAQDKLQTNFKNILNKFKKQQHTLQQHQDQMIDIEQKLILQINNNQAKNNESLINLSNRINKCYQFMQELGQKQAEHERKLQNDQQQIKKNQSSIINLSNVLDQKVGVNLNLIEQASLKSQGIQKQLYKLYEEIIKKEDSTQVLKIVRDVDNTKQKLAITQRDIKMLQHKLEKMELYNQKNQRIQIKKQTQIFKEIQDKIKKQVKILQKSISNGASSLSYGASTGNKSGSASGGRQSGNGSIVMNLQHNIEQKQNENGVNTPQSSNSPQKIRPEEQMIAGKGARKSQRLSFRMQEDEAASFLIRNSIQKISSSKINQKMATIQNKIKNIQTTVQNLCSSSPKKKSKKNDTQQQIKQKINQIKPQLIKIWTKCDTLDDRIVFNQKKMEEKNKVLSNLLETHKENGVGKVDDKLKSFQTEIYASIKQLKIKLDAKVNCQEYQKQCLATEDKMRQITQILFLKSDKLQVKKALLFLESKIKQIILVISQDQENQKDALLTKKQVKCISCDKEVDKFSKFASTGRGNWDAMPMKDHSPQTLGKFGMTRFGSLSKNLRKLESKQLPILKSKKNSPGVLEPIVNTLEQK